MTLHEAKARLNTGDRVWVEGEDCYGIVQEFDRSGLSKGTGIDVLLESDGVVVSAAIGQIQFESDLQRAFQERVN